MNTRQKPSGNPELAEVQRNYPVEDAIYERQVLLGGKSIQAAG